MAKKPTPTPAPDSPIDPEAIYHVKLTRAVPFGRMMLRPQDDVRLKGKAIVALGDVVESYTLVE